MKTLIVGGAGYVGSVMTHDLWSKGHDVTVLDSMLFGCESLVSLMGQPRFRFIKADIRDESLGGLDETYDNAVLLSAIVGEPACDRDPAVAKTTNIDGPRNVLQWAQNGGCQRFVFASTCSNYGVTSPDSIVDEDTRLAPNSVYSRSKVLIEQEVLAAKNNGFCPTVLRLSTAFGISPRMRFDLLVSDFVLEAFTAGKITIYGEQFWRPFVHVRDISQAVATVLSSDPSPVSGEVFNVGDDHNNLQKIGLAELVQLHLPSVKVEFVKRETDLRSYRVSFSRIRERLGFSADWSVDRGIEELCTALENGVWYEPHGARHRN